MLSISFQTNYQKNPQKPKKTQKLPVSVCKNETLKNCCRFLQCFWNVLLYTSLKCRKFVCPSALQGLELSWGFFEHGVSNLPLQLRKKWCVLHVAGLNDCGETGLTLAGFVKWLHLNEISNEHKNSVSEMAAGKITLRQPSVFRLVNLSKSARLYSYSWSSWLPSSGLEGCNYWGRHRALSGCVTASIC